MSSVQAEGSGADRPKTRSWSGELDGGWKVALSLSPEYHGHKKGVFFWLFDKQDVEWSEKGDVITLKFKDAWHQYSDVSTTLQWKVTEQGLSLMAHGLSETERKGLKDVRLKLGGPAAHQLGSSRDRRSPYSRYHERTYLTLDVNGLPVGLAELAIGIFQSGRSEVKKLCRHREMPRLALQTLIQTATETRDRGHRKNMPPWQNGETVLLSLADHPNLEREDLEKLWTRPFIYWAPLIWRKARDHPEADPAWGVDFKNRITAKGEDAERMRAILANDKGLDVETLDVLLDHCKVSKRFRSAGDLSIHPQLDEQRMWRLYEINQWDSASGLAGRKDIPQDLLKKILEQSEGALEAIMGNVDAPEAVRAEAALKLSKHKELNHAQRACKNESLPLGRMEELVSHAEPMIRAELARNINFPKNLHGKLLNDDYRVVAEAARRTYKKRYGEIPQEIFVDLRNLTDLKPYYSIQGDIQQAIDHDDLESYYKWVGLLWKPIDNSLIIDSRIKSWVSRAVSKKSYKCLKAWVAKDDFIRLQIAEVKPNEWDGEIIDIMLGEHPDEKTQGKMILGSVKTLNLKMVDEYQKRKLSIEAANQHPLIWYAVAFRSEEMIRKLLSMGVDPNVSKGGEKPAAIAAQMNFVAALKLLPVDDQQRKKLEAFKSEYPGDPKAAWLGAWTNNKSEFKTVSMLITGDGNGTLYSAVGIGMPFVWKAESKTKAILFPVTKAGVNQDIKLEAEMTAEGLTLRMPKGKAEKMIRPKKREEIPKN